MRREYDFSATGSNTYVGALPERMDRKQVVIAPREELDRSDDEYWSRASMAERMETITYLRECFYGEYATTGRLQRVCSIVKLK